MYKCMLHVYACTSVVYIYSMYMIMVLVSIIVLSFVCDTYKIMVIKYVQNLPCILCICIFIIIHIIIKTCGIFGAKTQENSLKLEKMAMQTHFPATKALHKSTARWASQEH